MFRSFVARFNFSRQIFLTSNQPTIRLFSNINKSLFSPVIRHFSLIAVDELRKAVQFAEKGKEILFPDLLKNSEILSSPAENSYVPRPKLEEKIKEALTSPAGEYCVVYGNKGVGKSEVVTHAAIGQKGVVRIDVISAHDKNDLVKQLLEKLKVKGELRVDELVEEMKKVCDINFGGHINKIYPTIIFDVECGGVAGYELGIDAVRSLSKALVGVCRCIIILSEANAVRHFGNDPFRERFIFVDEFTNEEAVNYLVKIGSTLGKTSQFTKEEMEYVFTNIGTNPALLKKLAISVPNRMTLQEFVDMMLANATEDLAAFPLKRILQALKDPQYSDGVPPRYFNNLEEEGVDLTNHRAVGKAMKDNPNPIIYRQDLKKYQLLSTAHKTALRTYVPINPIPIPNAPVVAPNNP